MEKTIKRQTINDMKNLINDFTTILVLFTEGDLNFKPRLTTFVRYLRHLADEIEKREKLNVNS